MSDTTNPMLAQAAAMAENIVKGITATVNALDNLNSKVDSDAISAEIEANAEYAAAQAKIDADAAKVKILQAKVSELTAKLVEAVKADLMEKSRTMSEEDETAARAEVKSAHDQYASLVKFAVNIPGYDAESFPKFPGKQKRKSASGTGTIIRPRFVKLSVDGKPLEGNQTFSNAASTYAALTTENLSTAMVEQVPGWADTPRFSFTVTVDGAEDGQPLTFTVDAERAV